MAILEAALDLLGNHGPDGFTAAALAQAAGVSKATLFHHFATLDLIPLAAFEQVWLKALAPEQLADVPLRAYLEGLGQELIVTARERRAFLNAYFVFFTQALFSPPLRQRLVESSQTMHRVLREALLAKLPASMPAATLEATVHLVELALDGMGLHLLVLSEEQDLARAWTRLIDLIAPDGDA
ncbi:MAG: TetR/AcrR family transcriptional regulator [Herpetosiphonaceae bacterium]|nr:TetR/AcrR family transcriptional regulator [Herpetosiphonaceae bacterium]